MSFDAIRIVADTSFDALYINVNRGLTGAQGEPGTTDYDELDNKPTLGTAAASNFEDFAAALTSDENYVTDAEKVVIGNTSGTNTGDQDLSGLATQSALAAFAEDAVNDLAAETAAREAAIDDLGFVAGVLPLANGGTGATSFYTSPSVYIGVNQNALYFAHKDDLDADAETYITTRGLGGSAALAVDDVVKMIKGEDSSTSLRGSTWTTLSANRWTNAKGIYLFPTAYKGVVSTTMLDLRGANNLTVAGSPVSNSTGMIFDGVNDQLNASGSLITSGQWSCLAVGSSTVASKVIVSQSDVSNFRTAFLSTNSSGNWAAFKRIDLTSYNHDSGLSSVTRRSVLNIQDATHIRSYASGSGVALASTEVAETTVESSTFIIGNSDFGSSNFTGSLSLVLIWNENVAGDYAAIHANLNSLLGLGL